MENIQPLTEAVNLAATPIIPWLIHRLKVGPCRLVVTSTWPGEGKSTLALALARQIALLKSKSVLLIDGDLRNPTLSYRVDLHQRSGLAEVASEASPRPTRLEVEYPLFGLGAGQIHKEVTERIHEVLQSERLPEYFAAFDLVIIDSPPMTACEDAVLWGELCDGVLYVISAKKFGGASKLQLETFRDRGVPILGTIITHGRRASAWGRFLTLLGLRN